MIIALIILIISGLSMATFLASLPYLDEWFRRRHVVRQSAIEADMKALMGAQQLAALAWKARHEMYDIVERDARPDGNSHASVVVECNDQ